MMKDDNDRQSDGHSPAEQRLHAPGPSADRDDDPDAAFDDDLRPGHPAFEALYEPRQPQSGVGIASVVIGLAILLWTLVLHYWFAILLGPPSPGGAVDALLRAYYTGRAVIPVLGPFLGLVLALSGLRQTDRRKEYVYFGLALNAIVFVGHIVPFSLRLLIKYNVP